MRNTFRVEAHRVTMPVESGQSDRLRRSVMFRKDWISRRLELKDPASKNSGQPYRMGSVGRRSLLPALGL